MVKYFTLGLLSAIFSVSTAKAADLVDSTQNESTADKVIVETQKEVSQTPQKRNLPQIKNTPQKKSICKISSSESERWIKKNYKNCKKCGVFRNHSQKTYYCYCDCN